MSAARAKGRDGLTGLDGYDACVQAVRAAIAGLPEDGTVSACLVDVDGFAAVNDRHGHAVGDAVLKAVAGHLVQGIGARGSVFRYAGDEFMAVLPGVEKEEAFLVLEGLRGAFDREHELEAEDGPLQVALTLSVGVAAAPEDGRAWQALARKAGDAVHRAKVSGRNKVCLAREERMVTKTSHYTQGQLDRLAELAGKEGPGEAVLLREALDDLLRKYKL
jgi:diguanylate cyclase (GGDEF)-like protein